MLLRSLFSLRESVRTILSEHFTITDDWTTDCEVIWIRLEPFTQANRRRYPKLRAVVTATTGTDHITARDIEVLSLKGETAFLETVHATAEHTIALILALLRNLTEAVGRGVSRMACCGTELHGKTVLVVGRGRVGKQVGAILDAFGSTVIYVDRDGDLMASLPLADIVTVHVDLSPSTEAMFSHAEFMAMKTGAYFINTSRGAVVDERALQDALYNHLSGAALDVHANEPGPPQIRGYKNLIVTPHIGGCTVESMEKTEIFMARKLIEWKNSVHARQHRVHEQVLPPLQPPTKV